MALIPKVTLLSSGLLLIGLITIPKRCLFISCRRSRWKRLLNSGLGNTRFYGLVLCSNRVILTATLVGSNGLLDIILFRNSEGLSYLAISLLNCRRKSLNPLLLSDKFVVTVRLLNPSTTLGQSALNCLSVLCTRSFRTE